MCSSDLACMRDTLELYFEHSGYRVVKAANGAEALDAISKQAFKLCLVDVNLGGDDGFKFCASIKDQQPSAKVVVMTGMDFDPMRLREAHTNKADAYLEKGIPIADFKASIQRALQAA